VPCCDAVARGERVAKADDDRQIAACAFRLCIAVAVERNGSA
jgi:hypothetical protein